MRKLAYLLLFAGLASLALIGGLGLLAGVFWQAEMINPFRPQILLVAALGLIASLMLKDSRAVMLAMAVLGLSALPMATRLLIMQCLPAQATEAQKALSIVCANVLFENRKFDHVIAMVKRENPDFFVAVETSPPWLEGLKPLEKQYPYRMAPDLGIFGISIYDKKPFHGRIERIGPTEMPLARVQFDDITLIVAHPMPPARQRLARDNAYYLDILAQLIKATSGKVYCRRRSEYNPVVA
jgi:endonuclease/exonuclease/phosphatase (EEP) superfamily protein YafD